jgi:hypothetical protein
LVLILFYSLLFYEHDSGMLSDTKNVGVLGPRFVYRSLAETAIIAVTVMQTVRVELEDGANVVDDVRRFGVGTVVGASTTLGAADGSSEGQSSSQGL